MKKLILCLALLSAAITNAQQWRDLGAFGEFTSVNYGYIEVLENGTPVVTLATVGGGISIKEWNGTAWIPIPISGPMGDGASDVRMDIKENELYVGFYVGDATHYFIQKYNWDGTWTTIGDMSTILYLAENDQVDFNVIDETTDQINFISRNGSSSNAQVYQFDGSVWNLIGTSDFLTSDPNPESAYFDLENNGSEYFMATEEVDSPADIDGPGGYSTAKAGGINDLRFYAFDGVSTWNPLTYYASPYIAEDLTGWGTDQKEGSSTGPIVGWSFLGEPDSIKLAYADIPGGEIIDLSGYYTTDDVDYYGIGLDVDENEDVLVAYATTAASPPYSHVVKYDYSTDTWGELGPGFDEAGLSSFAMNHSFYTSKPYFLYNTSGGSVGVRTFNNEPILFTSDTPDTELCEGETDAVIYPNIQTYDGDNDSLWLVFTSSDAGVLPVANIVSNRLTAFDPSSTNHSFELIASPINLGTTTLDIWVTDGLDSTLLFTQVVEVSPLPEISSIALTNSSCGAEDGAADATVTGGTGTLSYYWSNGATTEDISGLAPGTYYLTVEDDNECYALDVATITDAAMTIGISQTNILCNGDATGALITGPTGGVAPYEYYWSNGARTQEIADLTAGQYEVFITDATGCMTTASYIITEASKMTANFTETAATCGISDGGIDITVTGGEGTYSYQWYNGSGSPVGTALSLTGVPADDYSVEVTDGSGCLQTFNTGISNIGAPVITIESITAATCADDGEMNITATSGSSTIAGYEWSTGETTEDLSGKAAGYYSVQVVDAATCIAVKGMNVPAMKPASQQICMVTVDTATNTNRIVWEKPITSEIDHYNIYRESSVTGMFQFVDDQTYTAESFFVDSIAYPQVRSWRYKMTAVNNCGVESVRSVEHKTIHIVFNETTPGIYQLNWDAYEGFMYADYNIWRYTDTEGWVLLSTQSTTMPPTYTDTPSSAEGIDYIIEVIPPSSCESTKATDHNSSRSNKTSNNPITPGGVDDLDIDETGDLNVSVYPNPTEDAFNIIINEGNNVQTIKLFDLSGKLVYGTTENSTFYTIDLNNFESSVYILEIVTDLGTHNQKVIKR